MLSFDWSNIFLLILILVFFMVALRTDNPNLRFVAHIGVFVGLMSILHPLFAVLYGAFAGWHVWGGQE